MTEKKPHILIVDDDARLRELLCKFLIDNGFLVSTAEDVVHAQKLLGLFVFDLVVLDVMMPGQSGLDLTDSIRGGTNRLKGLPILLLTAMGEVDNRVEGLTRGADDYLSKPFDPRELLLRMNAILKRSKSTHNVTKVVLGETLYDSQKNILLKGGLSISLTTVESCLLKILCKYAGKTLSREDLVEEYEGNLNPRTVDVQITRLRRKIETDPKVPRYLQTVRGKGYVLIPDS